MPNEYAQFAQRMVEEQLCARGIQDERVLAAMATVPRHLFVPAASPSDAYADRALPTASGQTISQPYMVALMTELLAAQPGDKVLEIGTGSGYQTAVLATLGAKVVTIERVAGLTDFAQARLRELQLDGGVAFEVGDGTLGWPAGAPYAGILVTAGAPRVPLAFRRQLSPAGRIVIPIGDRVEQQLMVIWRDGGQWRQQSAVGCRFVPLIGADGWEEI